jgi:hypothetical protein
VREAQLGVAHRPVAGVGATQNQGSDVPTAFHRYDLKRNGKLLEDRQSPSAYIHIVGADRIASGRVSEILVSREDLP